MNYFLLTDSHLKNTAESLDEFSRLLKALKKENNKGTLIHLGDVVDDGSPETFKKAITYMKENFSQIFLTLGNHDLIWKPEIPKKAWITPNLYDGQPQLLKSYRDFLNLKENLFYEKKDKEGIFLVLCTQHKIKESCACYLEKDQVNWLRKRLDFYQKIKEIRPIFILSHQALNKTHLGSELYGGFGPQNQEIKEILEKITSPLQVYFLNGHLHNGLKVPFMTSLGEIKLVDLPPVCLPNNGYPHKNVITYLTVEKEQVSWRHFRLKNENLEEIFL